MRLSMFIWTLFIMCSQRNIQKVGMEIDEAGTKVIDHGSVEYELDDGSHTTINISPRFISLNVRLLVKRVQKGTQELEHSQRAELRR